MLVANLFLSPDKSFDRHQYGHDFLPFYTAGQIVRMGKAPQLYDPQLTKTLEHQTCSQAGMVIHNEYGAFLNPPFAALPAASLAYWPYSKALWIWTVFLAAFFVISVNLLIDLLATYAGWRSWGLIPLLLFTALPVWQAAIHAQNTFFSLMILSATVTLWRNQKPFTAGLVAGLLFFKPQLGAILGATLIIMEGWPAFFGLAISGFWLLIINLIALPGTLTNYLTQLPVNLRAIQILPNYVWQRHVTFLAWWRMLLQGHVGALPNTVVRMLALTCSVALGLALARAVWKFRGDPRRRDRLIAAAIVSMPLIMPYFMDYDLTLLSVAAVLCAIDAIRNGRDRRVTLAWVTLYAACEINALVAGITPIIPVVPCLLVLSITLIDKARAPFVAAEVGTATHPYKLAA